MGREDGRYAKVLLQLSKTEVLVLDGWGLATLPINTDAARWKFWATVC